MSKLINLGAGATGVGAVALPTIYSQFFVGCNTGVAFTTTSSVLSGTPTWTALNTGLDSVDMYDVNYHQGLGYVYALSPGGIYRLPLPVSGSDTWTKIVSNAAVQSAGGPATFRPNEIVVSWNNSDIQWAVCHAGSSPYLPFVLKTTNNWSTFSYYAIPVSSNPLQELRCGGIGVARGSNDQTLWAGHMYVGYGAALSKSVNGGQTWSMVRSGYSWQDVNVTVPDGSDNVIACVEGAGDDTDVTLNGGSVWDFQAIGQPHHVRHKCGSTATMYLAGRDAFFTWNGSDWAVWSASIAAPGANELRDALCVEWSGSTMVTIIGAGWDDHKLRRFKATTTNVDITNNLATVLGSLTTVYVIGRELGQWNEDGV